jgi:hypothetical protein
VDPVPDPLLLRKPNRAGIKTGTSGSVARNSDHKTTEAVLLDVYGLVKQKPTSHIASATNALLFL